ncbi:hypothetical protein [Streptomyces sp. NPDC051014]|uniref:hypothetical protein n=1 Tax=Streptomyces sp. NPDC051014 TaxID=3155751 RepID=UPI0033F2E29A
MTRATLDAATTERVLLPAEVYRRGRFWRIRAAEQGCHHDLAATARVFSVGIID